MGCVFGKSVKDGQKKRESSVSRVAQGVLSEREESFRMNENLENGAVKIASFGRKVNGSMRFSGVIRKAMGGELIAAGWPSWLASVAGEAINGWVPRKADTFEKLEQIGQGTYSSVYKARDLSNNKIVALKRVTFNKMDLESVKFMAREIVILRRLDHPNIIKLEGLIISRASCTLYLVFEYMEHDLAGLACLPGIKFTEPQVKCYMQQLLSGLDHCHSHGVLHRDIKAANLLVDNHGTLKIADFGLANFFDNQQSVPLTSRVVTLWYRPPELLLGASHYGVAVDLWSTGCILGELYVGKPIMPGRTEVEQIHKIFKLCGSPSEEYWKNRNLPHSKVFKPTQPYGRCIVERFKELPPCVVGLLDTLLSVDPALRGTAAEALKSEFFTVKPFACDPSSLPTYPPSKEIDAKLRTEKTIRRENANGSKELQAAPAHDANAKQGKQKNSNPKSQSDRFNLQKEAASGFPNDPCKASQAVKETTKDHLENLSERFSHSGPLGLGVEWEKSTYQAERPARMLDEHSGKRDQKYYAQKRQNYAGSNRFESGRASVKEANLHEHDYMGDKMHFSGSLLVQSNKMHQMPKDHDRHIQEAERRARIEKARVGNARAHGK